MNNVTMNIYEVNTFQSGILLNSNALNSIARCDFCTFHRMRLMMLNKRIPAMPAIIYIHNGTLYGVSSPGTGSMFTTNCRKGEQKRMKE